MKRCLLLILLTLFLCASTGCSTVFYPSRMHLPPEKRDRLHFGMFLLDFLAIPAYGLGLLGLIIDFTTGCIWIPNMGSAEKVTNVACVFLKSQGYRHVMPQEAVFDPEKEAWSVKVQISDAAVITLMVESSTGEITGYTKQQKK